MHNSENKQKKSMRFSDVTVYYFQRVQGFSCVPGDPGATLGELFFYLSFQIFKQRVTHTQCRICLAFERAKNLNGNEIISELTFPR